MIAVHGRQHPLLQIHLMQPFDAVRRTCLTIRELSGIPEIDEDPTPAQLQRGLVNTFERGQ